MATDKTSADYERLIEAEVTKITGELCWPQAELKDTVIFDSLTNINQFLSESLAAGFSEPTQAFPVALEKIQRALKQNLEKRVEHLRTLQQTKSSDINEQLITKMKAQVISEKAHLSKVYAISGKFLEELQVRYFSQMLDSHKQAVEEFESQANDFEYRIVFSDNVVALEARLKDSLNALKDEDKNQLVATIESMAQVIDYRRRIYPNDNNLLINRARILITTIIESMRSYRDQLIGHALQWLRTSHNTVADHSEFSKEYRVKYEFYTLLHEKLEVIARLLQVSYQENEPVAKTLAELLENQQDSSLKYQGQLNLIALEKWELINQIFADCENYTCTARLWTTPTGINELLSLKKRWNQLGNQQLTNVDYYFGRVNKIINNRLEENAENKDQKRTTETHNFYLDYQKKLSDLKAKQKDQWVTVINAALSLGNYSDAQSALVKMQLPKDEKVKYWINLTAAIFNKVCTSEIDERERDKHLFYVLRAAKLELLEFPLEDQIRFYDELLSVVNNQNHKYKTQLMKILLLARSIEDAHDPQREDHAWFGRATGIEEIIQKLPEPVYFLYELSNKNKDTTKNSETVWEWVDGLIQELVRIVSSRLNLSEKQTTRHVETQKFYVATNNNCAQYLPEFATMYNETPSKLKSKNKELELQEERGQAQKARY